MTKMTGETVEQLADSIRKIYPDFTVERLIAHLKSADIPVSGPTDTVNASQKKTLLEFLKKDHGETASSSVGMQKIKLNRSMVTTLKAQSGKAAVTVVQKKSRVYIRRETPVSNDEEKPIEADTIEEVIPEVVPAVEVLVSADQVEALAETKEGKEAAVAVDTAGAAIVPEVAKPKDLSEHKPAKHKGRGGRASFEDSGPERTSHKPKTREEDEREWRQGKGLRGVAIPTVLGVVEGEEESAETRLGRKIKSKSKMLANERHKKELQGRHSFAKPTKPVIREVLIPDVLTVMELSQKLSVKSIEVIKTLMKLGVMATINQPLEPATAAMVVEALGHKPKIVKDSSLEETLVDASSTENLLPRAPVVTVMGHVDHGKTSLLDYIRRSKVTAGEAGGITQHIGAYHVKTNRGEITFLDTPGHAAFTQMRARGVQCTDIVILVVAADDGVMPQTIEAIKHAQAAKVPIIVAVNKMDKPDADLTRVQNELAQQGLISEAWGGDMMFVPVSAKEGTGVDALLEGIILQAEMLELKAPQTGLARGVVLEARLDKGQGPVASVLVQKGILHRGDILLAGSEYGRVRAMINELGQQVASLGPSMPVEVLGLSGIPSAGDLFMVVKDERNAKEIAASRQGKNRDLRMSKRQATQLEGFFERAQLGDSKVLKIVIKADVQGSAEALSDALTALSTPDIKVEVVSQGVGGISESDITLALASSAIMIGFNVRAEAAARRLAETEELTLNYYSIIYDVVDGVKRAINGMLGPQFKENIIGTAEVREVFHSAKLGAIAGCMVRDGVIKRHCPIRVLRNNVVIYQGELESLRRFKDDVSEVRQGTECGIGVKNYNDIKPGDQIEVYETVEIKREG